MKPTAGLETTQKRYRRPKARQPIPALDLARRHLDESHRRRREMRWRVECDYEELKSEPGLAYFVTLARMP